jgi:hypothetical protein
VKKRLRTKRRRTSRWWRPALKWAGLVAGSLAGLALVALAGLWFWAGGSKLAPSQMAWGFTYSSSASRGLGLDPRATYLALLDELRPKRLRLAAYWTEIEPADGRFDYQDLDFQVAEAERRGIPYVIAVGRKVPRWPECYTPGWAKQLPAPDQQSRLLRQISHTVERYDHRPHLLRWQVENEPFLRFGEGCPEPDAALLGREIAQVKRLSTLPVMITDSGETDNWLNASKYGDVFGSTLYRVVLNPKGHPFHHFLTPAMYTRRGNLMKKLHPNVKQLVIAELQAEPWTNIGIQNLPDSYRDLTLSHQQFDANISFARDVGFSETYLWGAEWWYYEKLHHDSYYYDQAARLFAQSAK